MDPRIVPSDDWLDEQLRAVSVPDGLADSLRRIPYADEADIDESLRDVPLPWGFSRRLHRLARPVRAAGGLARWAVAASVFLVIGLATLGPLAWLFDVRLKEPVRLADRSGAVDGGPAVRHQPVEIGLEQAMPGPVESPWDRDLAQMAEGPSLPLASLPAPGERRAADRDAPQASRGGGSADGGSSRLAQFDPLLETTSTRWPVLAAHRAFDDLPELKKLPRPAPQGMRTPLSPGFDLSFFIRAGVHPFVVPAHPKSHSVTVPLGSSTSSYELARRWLADGECPPPAAVRIEEFLAAVAERFPVPKDNVMALRVAGGASPFGAESLRLLHGGDALRLLHVGVQARDLELLKRQPVHLTLAVDVSASMAWEGRLEAIVQALGALVGLLQPDDRLSIVTFSERAEVLVEDAGRRDVDAVRSALRRLAARGSTGVGAGLAQSYTVSRRAEAPSDCRRRVVLLTDGLAELDANTLKLMVQNVSEATRRGIELDVVDLRPDSEIDDLESQMEILATAGKGKVRRATDADQIRWTLLEILTGQSQVVAKDVSLSVKFFPSAVLEYRLFGHEANAVAGLMPVRAAIDFRSGQTSGALFEVRLRPKGSDDVALVELRWKDPQKGQRQTLSRKVTRGQFAGSAGSMSMALQAAAVAAEAAEILRNSPFARGGPNSGSLRRTLELLGQLDSRLLDRPGFADLVMLIRQAEKAKPYVRGGTR